jgi:hypothetical protein
MSIDWDKIKEEYINTNATYKDLAEKYNIPFYRLKRQAASEKWFDEKKKVQPAGERGLNNNLIPMSTRSKEEASAIGRKGGIISGKNRRQRRKARECMEEILSCDVPNGKIKDALIKMGIKEENIQNTMVLMFSLFQNGLKTGDAGTVKTILEIAGDMDIQQEQQSPTININVSAATAEDAEND